MKIKNIYVHSFGKLKDLNLDLQEGLNIIYGSNESGKSTIQHFIKAMFYGMNSQKRAIADNERKKYMPWDNSRAGGRLTFQDEKGIEYVIDRSFGATKKEDSTVVYNFNTGQEAFHLDNYQPGKDIFGLGEDAFEKTLFIKQLGAKVAMDKEDEIMKKLSNIQESGQEDISYNKAKVALENYKKSLRGSRKQGKLDVLEERVMSLKLEQQELEALHRSNLEDSKLLQETMNKIRLLEHNLEQALKRKNDLKNSVIDSEEEKKFKDKHYSGSIKEAEELIYKAIEALAFFKERYEALKTMEEEGNKLKDLLEKEVEVLKNYGSFKDLEEGIDKKLNALAMEKRDLEGILQQQSFLEEEVKALQGRIIYLNSELQEDGNLLNITTDDENNILKLEEQLQDISFAIESEKLKNNSDFKKDIIRDKRINYKFLMIVSLFISLALIYGLIFRNVPATIIGLVGILTIIYGYSQYRKATSQLRTLEKSDESNLKQLLKDKAQVEERLQKFYNKFQVQSYMELKNKLDGCRDTLSTIKGIKSNIEDKEKQLEKLRTVKVEERLEQIEKYYRKLLETCNCRDLEEFYHSLKDYKDLHFNVNLLQDQYMGKRDEIEKKCLSLTSAEKELKQLLCNFKSFDSNKAGNLVYYESYIEGIKESIEIIRKSQEEGVRKLNKEVDELDDEIAELNRNITESKELKKDIEHKIKTRFNNKRELWRVEDELQQCRDQIVKLKKLYEANQIASIVLEEAFQEVQSNFIPTLNTEVANILGSITKGKYNRVTVSPSDNYEIKVLQEESLRSLEFLSGGTFDQVYFSLRLALSNLIFKEKNVPIILDDAFIQYDDNRLYSAMMFLQEYSKEHQIIIFTCRKLPIKETINLDFLQ